MTRKTKRSDRTGLRLNLELKGQESQVREFLATAGQPPVLPPGCNFQITWLEPSVMREFKRRERKAHQQKQQ